MMQTTPIHHDTFAAITLRNETFTGFWMLVRKLRGSGKLSVTLRLSWMAVASLFVLGTSTWMSAMTGYTFKVSLYIRDQNDNLAKGSIFRPVVYIVHDGERLSKDLGNEAMITAPWSSGDEDSPRLEYPGSYGCYAGTYEFTQTNLTFTRPYYDSFTDASWNSCKWLWAISK
jgi:hypothetical protein